MALRVSNNDQNWFQNLFLTFSRKYQNFLESSRTFQKLSLVSVPCQCQVSVSGVMAQYSPFYTTTMVLFFVELQSWKVVKTFQLYNSTRKTPCPKLENSSNQQLYREKIQTSKNFGKCSRLFNSTTLREKNQDQ